MEDERTDPCRLPHYAGFVAATHCGRTEQQGPPAYEVLREELDFLGRIVGRDLYGEIVAAVHAPDRRLPLKVLA
jgi:hypothetical protein